PSRHAPPRCAAPRRKRRRSDPRNRARRARTARSGLSWRRRHRVLFPTRRLAALFAVCAVLSFFAVMSPEAKAPLYILDALFVVLGGLDALFLVGKPRFSVERVAPAIFSVGRYNAVTLTLRSRSRRRLRGACA